MKDFGRWFNDQAPIAKPIGIEEGAVCNRDNCNGIMKFGEVDNCTCFINPPCSACVNNPLYCDTCSYGPEDDEEKS